MDQLVEDVGGTVGECSYAGVLQGTVKVYSKQIFLKETDIFGTAKITRKSALRGTYTPGWCVINFDL